MERNVETTRVTGKVIKRIDVNILKYSLTYFDNPMFYSRIRNSKSLYTKLRLSQLDRLNVIQNPNQKPEINKPTNPIAYLLHPHQDNQTP